MNKKYFYKPGDKIGHLTIIKEIKKPYKKTYKLNWLCECECGKKVIRRQDYLGQWNSQNRIISCGCKHPMWTSFGKKSKIWKGYEELSGQFLASIRHGAQNRNIEFLVTKEYIWDLFIKQDRKCALSGLLIEFTQTIPRKSRKVPCKFGTASLDRIDSSLGYIEGNVQWVHKDINRMKNHFDEKTFLDYCKLITEHQKNKTP